MSQGIDVYFAQSWDFILLLTGIPYPIFRDVGRWIREIKPDVVHINSHLFFCSYQATHASRSFGIPAVLTVHGFVASRGAFYSQLQQVYIRLFGKSIFKNSTRIICLNSSDAANVAKTVGSYARVSVVPNGADTDLFKPATSKPSKTIVWVGRLVPEKGLTYLLDAMKKVVASHPDAKLLLVGDGNKKQQLENLARRDGLDSKISFLGSLDRAAVARILSAGDVFAFPSLREGMPLALLEAMASGLPVVSSNISGVNGLVTDGVDGILVPPKDSEALANALLMLLSDESLRKKLGQNARKSAEEHSLDKAILKTEAVYAEALAMRRKEWSEMAG